MQEKEFIIPEIEIFVFENDEIVATSGPESTPEDPHRNDIY